MIAEREKTVVEKKLLRGVLKNDCSEKSSNILLETHMANAFFEK